MMLANMEPFTPSSTPPVPARNPNHQYLPSVLVPGTEWDLVPEPLNFRRRRPRLEAIHVTIHNVPQLQPASPSKEHTPSSPATSFRSSSSAISASSSSPPTSAPSSPTSRPRAFTYSFPPSDVSKWGNEWGPFEPPRHSLRRKPSPKKETLRSLRAKESEACLQRAYEQQLEAYLNGSIFPRARRKESLGTLQEE